MKPPSDDTWECFREQYDLLPLIMPHFLALQDAVAARVSSEICARQSTAFNVLEIGCGIGTTTKKLLIADGPLQITAVDNDLKAIELLTSALKRYVESGQLVVRNGDALETLSSLDDAGFDGVASALTLHHFSAVYRQNVVHEIARVLKPGGVFVDGDKIAQDDESEHRKEFQWQLERFSKIAELGYPARYREWVDHYHEDDSPERRRTEGSAIRELTNAGFVDVELFFRNHMEIIIQGRKPR